MGLFEKLKEGWTADEIAVYEAARAEFKLHNKQRPCPSACGCTEFYDDRKPDVPDGGFGHAGCDCKRCNHEGD